MTASDMLNDLAVADTSSALSRRLQRYCRPRLLCVDEVGYLAYDSLQEGEGTACSRRQNLQAPDREPRGQELFWLSCAFKRLNVDNDDVTTAGKGHVSAADGAELDPQLAELLTQRRWFPESIEVSRWIAGQSLAVGERVPTLEEHLFRSTKPAKRNEVRLAQTRDESGGVLGLFRHDLDTSDDGHGFAAQSEYLVRSWDGRLQAWRAWTNTSSLELYNTAVYRYDDG